MSTPRALVIALLIVGLCLGAAFLATAWPHEAVAIMAGMSALVFIVYTFNAFSGRY